MFPWNIAKSAEAMFSRWAIKRVCKFLLKKKLGQFILGDIDLNQLDVQLRAGTIQLSDLALNVDYLNQKFGAASSLLVKEGSIGSLLITMPWKGKGCQIEVDELELVLAPCRGKRSEDRSEISNQGGNYCIGHDLGKLEHERVGNVVGTASVDVHEGVKTIAKMVKWLLSSFHVKVKKLIFAFDPCFEGDKNKEFCRSLVLRITEVECGTCISEEVNSNGDATSDNFLGLSQLTTFIKFEGAILEFLQIDGVCNQIPSASGTTFGECFSACCPSNVRIPIVAGERVGFSGTLKLSVPWKNGSLDIRKVEADAYINPLQLRFQPSSIKCFLSLWDNFKNMGKNGNSLVDHKATESVYLNASSHCHSSILGSCMLSLDKALPDNESFFADCYSPMGKETVMGALLPGSHVISDWVPSSNSRNQRDRIEEEPDFGASMDQFFDCFDGLRNSQSALGNSGMWNWTCSVFSAITAASNLASGSVHIPCEKQHVETNLKVSVAGVSLLFSFVDEDQKHSSDVNGDQIKACSYVHYMGANFQDMHLLLQVCPREVNFEVTVKHIELSDHFHNGNDVMDFDMRGFHDDVKSQVDSILQRQVAVEASLPPFCSSAKDVDLEKQSGSIAADVPFGVHTMDKCICTRKVRSIYRDDVVKVTLLRTSGVSQCQFTVSSISGSSDERFTGPTSFSLKLPPFVFWVNFGLISMISDLMKEIENSFEMACTRSSFASQGDAEKNFCNHVTKLSSKESLRGDIFLPNARIILCFPFEKGGDFKCYSSLDQFIVLDFSSSSTLSEANVEVTNPAPVVSSKKRYSPEISRSLHLNVGNLDVFLITSPSEEIVKSNSCRTQKLIFLAENILSATDRTGHLSVISMLWREGSVTGPWMAKRAKLLATSEVVRSRNKFMGKGYEFASVTTVKDMEDFNTRTRREMILSSAFSLHAHLCHVMVNLGSSQYNNLHYLLHQVIDWLSCLNSNPVGTGEDSSVSQTSVLVECDSVAISLNLEAVYSAKGSIQSELPGSWHSFKLNIRKFELLSVSNIGGICSAHFLWVAHGEGNLWGSITGVPNEELLLISCSNSTMGRGDGEGSNVLSSRFSGSDIIHMVEPESFYSHTSITVRGGTIVAIGGRLDWLDSISSFFILPSPEIVQAGDNSLPKGDSDTSTACGSSFVLNLVDIGLSYEPHLNNLVAREEFDRKSGSAKVKEEMGEECVACLLVASSLKLSNTTMVDSRDRDYKIRVQDVGLLLCAVSGPKNVSGTYSVEHLRNIGFVKVAQEAHVEALLRMNGKNGHLWEVECTESHIILDTCHDTASGVFRLAGQLQQLFAPDVEESVVHLQTRWNNVQQAYESDEPRIFNDDSATSASKVRTSSLDAKTKPDVINLMDEICEDAFHLDGFWDVQSDLGESEVHISVNDRIIGEACNLNSKGPKNVSRNLSFTRLAPILGSEDSQTSYSQKSYPEFIEGYFLSDLQPLSELSLNNQSSNQIPKCKKSNVKNEEVQKGYSGWYGHTSLNFLENHVSEVSERTGQQLVEGEASSNHTKPDEYGKVRGSVLLKNMNVIWRMYAGSDWHNLQNDFQHSTITRGRDTTVCLELALSGMDFRYDIFPDGGVSASRLSLSVKDFSLNDNSSDAPWKLVLGYYQSKCHPRESSSKAFKLDLEAVRPDPLTPLEEYRLRIVFLPMRLHLHQCHLDFLISFFGGKSSSTDQSSSSQDSSESVFLPKRSTILGGHNITEEALLPYFQKFDIRPVLIRVDYSPCRVDLAALRGGKYVELVNLVPWKGVELQLKHVQAVGVYGWGCICETIIGEWLEDISQNQIHKLLKGLPPIRSLVAVGSGAAKFVSLPVKNYRKDHRLIKGMQRGTIAFLRSISLEAIGLGVHLAAGAHDILLQAEYILTSIPPSLPWPVQSRVNTNVRSNQPKDARQGIQQACESISDGFSKSASALVRAPLKRYQRGAGVGSTLVTAVQAGPAAAIAPASATARAVHCALLGVRNSLDPERKKESMNKYLGTTQPQ